MAKDFCAESYDVEGAQQAIDSGIAGQADRTNAGDGEGQNVIKESFQKSMEEEDNQPFILLDFESMGVEDNLPQLI